MSRGPKRSTIMHDMWGGFLEMSKSLDVALFPSCFIWKSSLPSRPSLTRHALQFFCTSLKSPFKLTSDTFSPRKKPTDCIIEIPWHWLCATVQSKLLNAHWLPIGRNLTALISPVTRFLCSLPVKKKSDFNVLWRPFLGLLHLNVWHNTWKDQACRIFVVSNELLLEMHKIGFVLIVSMSPNWKGLVIGKENKKWASLTLTRGDSLVMWILWLWPLRVLDNPQSRSWHHGVNWLFSIW